MFLKSIQLLFGAILGDNFASIYCKTPVREDRLSCFCRLDCWRFFPLTPSHPAKESASAPGVQQTRTLQREVPHKVQIQYLLFLLSGYRKAMSDGRLFFTSTRSLLAASLR